MSPERERRLVELTAQLINVGRAAGEGVDPPPQSAWEQLTRDARMGFQAEFGKEFGEGFGKEFDKEFGRVRQRVWQGSATWHPNWCDLCCKDFI